MSAPRSITNRRDINKIVSLYNKGQSLRQIAEIFGVAPATIRNYLLEEGVELRPRGGGSHQ